MSKRIKDGLPNTISRQRRWQIRMRRQGRCTLCGDPAVNGREMFCEYHKERDRVKDHLKYQAKKAAALKSQKA